MRSGPPAGVEGHDRLNVRRTAAGLKPMAENAAIAATSPEKRLFCRCRLFDQKFPACAFGLDSEFPFCSYRAPSLMGAIMRKVEIVEDPRSQRCWVAVDVKSGEPVMRLRDRYLLERLCESLEWRVVQKERQRSRNGSG
jgi:hypothetical protein